MSHHRRLHALKAQICAQNVQSYLDIQPLHDVGALVTGLCIRSVLRCGEGAYRSEIQRLREAVSEYGFLLFRVQGDVGKDGTGLSYDELLEFGKWFGSGYLHSSHRVHHRAEHPDIFRVSNDPDEGCFENGGVGTGGFHSDGFFLPNVYSHAVYQIVRVPPGGEGDTMFASYSKAVSALALETPSVVEQLRRFHTMSDTSGVIHPLLHRHPVTGDEVLLIGGIAGALEVFRGTADDLLASGVSPDVLTSFAEETFKTAASWKPLAEMKAMAGSTALVAVRRLERKEFQEVQLNLQELLSRPGMHYRHQWQIGDVVVSDNLAVAHKACKEAGDMSIGTRILHRVTVAGSHIIG